MNKAIRNSSKTNIQAGSTLVELIVSAAILGSILAIISAFLTSSLHLNELNLARSELRQNLSLAMELITAELNSAGSTGVSSDAGAGIEGVLGTCNLSDVDAPDADATKDRSSFKLDSATPQLNAFTIRYCDPYTTPRRAMAVSYKLQQDNNLWTLYRNERTVGTAGTFEPIVAGIRWLELEFQCKPPNSVCNPAPTSPLFDYHEILAITVKIAAQTTYKVKNAPQSEYSFGLGNDAKSIKGEDGYLYDYAEQVIRPISFVQTIF